MSSCVDPWEGFRGIAPSDLLSLADHCRAQATILADNAAAARAVGSPFENPISVGVARRLEDVGEQLVRLSADIASRAPLVEALHQSVIDNGRALWEAIAGAVTTVVRQPHGDPNRTGSTEPLIGLVRAERDVAGSDVIATFHVLDELLLDVAALGPDGELANDLAAIVGSLSVEDLVNIVDWLLAAGHDVASVARVGRAVAATWPAVEIRRLAESVGERLDRREVPIGALVGEALAGAANRASGVVLVADFASASGRLGFAMWASAADTADDLGTPLGVERLAEALARLGDVDLSARVVVEMIDETALPYGAAWLERLDAAIATIIDSDPLGVVGCLSEHADTDGRAMVSWLRRLLGEPTGGAHIHTIVSGVVPAAPIDPAWFAAPGPEAAFDNARVAAYLAGSLAAAVRLETKAALETVGNVASIAGVGEFLVSAWSKAAPVFEALIPGSFSLGIGGSVRGSSEQIDGAMWRLLERIDERFEIAALTGVPDLAIALDEFDERRDELIARWVP